MVAVPANEPLLQMDSAMARMRVDELDCNQRQKQEPQQQSESGESASKLT